MPVFGIGTTISGEGIGTQDLLPCCNAAHNYGYAQSKMFFDYRSDQYSTICVLHAFFMPEDNIAALYISSYVFQTGICQYFTQGFHFNNVIPTYIDASQQGYTYIHIL
ncbi:hypothetical protein D3C80_1114710 [compost metagenome]